MHKHHPEIPIEGLLTCAQDDIARGEQQRSYMLCLRVNSESIYNNIYIAALTIDYHAASAADQQGALLNVLRRLSNVSADHGFHKDSPVPSFLCLEVFDPYEPNGKRIYGGRESV